MSLTDQERNDPEFGRIMVHLYGRRNWRLMVDPPSVHPRGYRGVRPHRLPPASPPSPTSESRPLILDIIDAALKTEEAKVAANITTQIKAIGYIS